MKHLPADFYVRTPTLELYNLVQSRFFELGCYWFADKEKKDFWGCREEEMCIALRGGVGECNLFYSGRKYYESEANVPEISIADLMILSPEPKKKNLEIKGAPWKIETGQEDVSIGCCSFEKEKLKKTLKEILNLSHEDRAKKYYFTIFTKAEMVIHFYEGRNGLDVWRNHKFENTVPWKAVEELVAALEA